MLQYLKKGRLAKTVSDDHDSIPFTLLKGPNTSWTDKLVTSAVTHGDASASKTGREFRLCMCERLEPATRANLDGSQIQIIRGPWK